MFDIREELPAEQIQEIVEQPVEEVKEEQSKPQMRYLIKKGGKQVVSESSVNTASPPASRSCSFGDTSMTSGGRR